MASITVGILLRNYHLSAQTKDSIPQVSIKSNSTLQIHLGTLGKNMAVAIQNSVSTLLMILGFMVFFSILGNFLTETRISLVLEKLLLPLLSFFHLSENLSNGIITGILEITSGIKILASEIRIPFIQKICTTAFILGFGGFSVHMQVLSIVAEHHLSMKPYLLGKFLQGILASVYTYLLMKYTNFFHLEVVESFSYQSSKLPMIAEGNHLLFTLSLLILITIAFKILTKVLKQNE